MGLTRIASMAPVLLAWAAFSAKTPAAAAEDAKARTLYRCQDAGVTTFSDRPCGATTQERASAQVYVLQPGSINTSDPPPAVHSRSQKVQSKAPRKHEPDADLPSPESQRRQAETCRRIQASLRDIRSKMRAGYSAKEGERLRNRQHTLDQKRRAERCR